MADHPSLGDGLCSLDHWCPPCLAGEPTSKCMDLFQHPECGLVACETRAGQDWCDECPDHEACMTGYPCAVVRGVARAR